MYNPMGRKLLYPKECLLSKITQSGPKGSNWVKKLFASNIGRKGVLFKTTQFGLKRVNPRESQFSWIIFSQTIQFK